MLWRVRGVTTLTGGFGGLLFFAKSRSDDKVAPKADLPALTITSDTGLIHAKRRVSTSRRNRLVVSAAFRGPSGRSLLAGDARRGNHDLTTAGYQENVG
jgi:hypothetical protein